MTPSPSKRSWPRVSRSNVFALFLALWCVGPSASFAFEDCSFRVAAYETLCKAAVAEGVSVDYANRYFLSSQVYMRDEKSLELFLPAMIPVHRANEKRANNALVDFVPQIREHLRTYRQVYDLAEARYDVNREVIAAILAKETRLGRIPSTHDAFTVFNTLLRELPQDSERNRRLVGMAERNIVALMGFCYRNGIAPAQCRFKSSYAGAVGIPQFMPQNFSLIDYYDRAPGDLDVMEDAILSTARFLHRNAAFDAMIDWKKIPDMPKVEDAWYDYDFAHDNSSFAYAQNRNGTLRFDCYACGKPELDYLAGYVKKIMRYNSSSHYAVGVLRLAWEARTAKP